MMTTFGDRLRQFRIDNHLSQAQVAEQVPTNKSCVCRWEKGGSIREDVRQRVEDYMADYGKKGSNGVTSRKTNANASPSNLEAQATRLGMAVIAVRKAELEMERLKAPYEAAQAGLEQAKADLDAAESALLSKIG